MVQSKIYKVTGQTVILRAFTADEKEVAGNLQAFNGHFHQVAFCKLPYNGWPGHKAEALIGQ